MPGRDGKGLVQYCHRATAVRMEAIVSLTRFLPSSLADRVSLTLRKLEQELLACGHHVCLLTTVSGDPNNTHLEGEHPNRQVLFLDNSIPIPFIADSNNPDHSYQLGFALSRSVKQTMNDFEPTLIHIAAPDCTALHLVNYARRKEIPLMGTYHSNIPEYFAHYPGLGWLKYVLWGFFRHQYNFYQALYVPTPYIENFLEKSQKMDCATNLRVWGRGVDVDKFQPGFRSLQFRRDLGIGDSEVVLLWCGRLVQEKRVDIFCDTVRRLDEMGVNFRAVVVGAGPCEEEVKALPKTIFCGWMNPDELAVAYASSDVFLFPSSVETFGNVTLEAMASGLPVIVEAGCSGHLVHEDENGFACPAGDADAFFEATRQLVTDESLRLYYSQRSREISLTMEKRAVVHQMLDNYTHVTNEFYTVYGGRHANRDAVYRQKHSFVGGNHPRPVLLVLVECLFIMVFRLIFNMTRLSMMMQETLISMRPPAFPTTENPVSSPKGASTPPSSPQRSPVKRASYEPTTNPPSPESSPSVFEMNEIHLNAPGDRLLPVAEDDCETNTTASSGNDSHQHVVCSAPKANMPVSHVVAINFIRSIELICRTESHLRNSCKSGNERQSTGAAKRKNSIDGVIDSEGKEAAQRLRRNPGMLVM